MTGSVQATSGYAISGGLGLVQPTIGRILYAAIVEIETINVDVGLHLIHKKAEAGL